MDFARALVSIEQMVDQTFYLQETLFGIIINTLAAIKHSLEIETGQYMSCS